MEDRAEDACRRFVEVAGIGGGCCSRITDVVLDNAKQLWRLTDGKCVGANRFRQALVGGKAVGKSRLMKAMHTAAQEVFGTRRLVVVAYTASKVDSMTGPTPMAAICHACDLEPPPGLGVVDYESVRVMDAVDAALKDKDLFVYLLVDDVHVLFETRHPVHALALRELYNLGDNKAGRVHVVMTGDRVEELCFAKLDVRDHALYEGYGCLDMNKTKYRPWYFPS